MVGRDGSPTDGTLAADAFDGTAPTQGASTVLAERYEILGLLGAGGMGRVYRVRDRELGEVVALKVLHANLVGSDEMVERFRQEVRLARKVTHRNVARTFDIGEHGGEKFLTMELVRGEPLSARLNRGAIPLTDAIAIARAILAGMGAAHEAGIVHRDLKPDNVLLETGGRVVVTDFGIAHADVADAINRTTGPVGTPAYMAPEQVNGDSVVDARADVYALGAVLFEMLTGRRAWVGSSAFAVAAARLTEPPPDPRSVQPALPGKLASIVLRCLAREREQRYASCEELDAALAGVETAAADAVDAIRAAPVVANIAAIRDDARDRTVAVMPFRNLGPATDDYFALGLTEDLVDALSTISGLRVRGRGYAGAAEQDVADTGRRLGVDVVVDGAIRRAGEHLRVSARLVGVADGFQIWSSRFERPAAEAFGLNDAVASAIATALAANRETAGRSAPTDPFAIDLYFRARQLITQFWESSKESEAAELFRQALARAPNDPTILAGYVHAQLGRNVLAVRQPRETIALVRRALVAGPNLPDPWVALAAVRFNLHDDAPGAIRALRRALELGPSHGDAHDRTGRLLLEANVWDEALRYLDRAIWLDPMQPWARIDLMRASALVGDWEGAQRYYAADAGHQWESHRDHHRARIWSWPGAPEEPFPEVKTASRPENRAMLASFRNTREWRRTGHVPTREQLDPTLLALVATAPTGRARRLVGQLLAEQAAIAGNLALALELVGSTVDAGLQDLSWISRFRPFDPLRGDETFEKLRRTVEAHAERVAVAWRSAPETLDGALASLAIGA